MSGNEPNTLFSELVPLENSRGCLSIKWLKNLFFQPLQQKGPVLTPSLFVFIVFGEPVTDHSSFEDYFPEAGRAIFLPALGRSSRNRFVSKSREACTGLLKPSEFV